MHIGILLLNNWGIEDVHAVVQLAMCSMQGTCSAASGIGPTTSP